MSDKEKLYCGASDVLPRGFDDWGNMLDCVKSNQIRRFGIKKIDHKVVARGKALAKEDRERGQLRKKTIIRMIGMRATVNKLNGDVTRELKKKSLGKSFDKVKLAELKKKLAKARKEFIQVSKEFKGMEGGKLKASLISDFFKESHEKGMNNVGDFKIDKGLSGKWVKTYHNPIDDWTVVVHRGTSTSMDKEGAYDVFVDAQLAVNYKNNARFKKSEEIQKKAEQKYNPKRMTVLGSSLGGTLAQDSAGKDVHEIITSGKPTTPADILFKKRPKDNQFDIRTHTDPVSALKPLMPHKNDIQVKSKTPFNPIKSHLGVDVMGHFDPDKMIGHGKNKIDTNSIMNGGINLRKATVADLKKRIIVLKRGRTDIDKKKYNVSGKSKGDLVLMLEWLEKTNKKSLASKNKELIKEHFTTLSKKIKILNRKYLDNDKAVNSRLDKINRKVKNIIKVDVRDLEDAIFEIKGDFDNFLENVFDSNKEINQLIKKNSREIASLLKGVVEMHDVLQSEIDEAKDDRDNIVRGVDLLDSTMSRNIKSLSKAQKKRLQKSNRRVGLELGKVEKDVDKKLGDNMDILDNFSVRIVNNEQKIKKIGSIFDDRLDTLDNFSVKIRENENKIKKDREMLKKQLGEIKKIQNMMFDDFEVRELKKQIKRGRK
jgi:hypothetical protein